MEKGIQAVILSAMVKEDSMGSQLIWQERFNIGVDFIDEEHKKLFGVLDRMFMYRDQKVKSQWVCKEGIKYFRDHAMKHFTEEEVYMASIHYNGFETHRRLHDNFRKKTLPALEHELEQTKYSMDSVNHFLGVCAGWLIGHTLTEDHAITGKTASKWEKLLPEEEQIVMKNTILQLLFDMFQLDAKVISECYGGEKFGKGIYYRMVYGTGGKEKWEIVLVFEEKLIINTIGSLMGTESDEVSVMLLNAARYVSQQFVDRVSGHFMSSGNYGLIEENLMDYEQFCKVFKEHKPQSSLLFNTGKGYFAYCVIAPHLLHETGQVAIKAENAINEVQKYIDKNKENNKQDNRYKILVADDSAFMLETMKSLLGNDYNVTLADSGLSVIRNITLARPDLILLDYDMPVCDGRQVLEMIRSEKDFASIPVIFLTGRADKETVAKIMPLKPEGYMLKSLPKEQIKQVISNHFKRKKARNI